MEKIKYLFKSLYSNQTIIDGRKKHTISSIVMFVLGFFLLWIPILSKGYTTYCASALFNDKKTTNQEIDTAFLKAFDKDYFKAITFVKNSKTNAINLDFSGLNDEKFYLADAQGVSTQSDVEYKGTNEKELIKGNFSYTANNSIFGIDYYYDVISFDKGDKWKTPADTETVVYEKTDKLIPLQLFYLNLTDDYSDSDAIISFARKQILRISDDNTKRENFPHSFVVFTPNRIYLNIYSLHSAKTNALISSYQGVISDAFSDDVIGKTFQSVLVKDTDNISNLADKNKQIYQNFANTLHSMAFPAQVRTIWFNIGIISAVYVSVVLLASGALIFLHKRKRSTSRDTNYWEALKEAMVLAFTPAIIGLAVGFYNYTFEITIFVMCVLFRTFFIHSKIIPPSYTQNNKPLYQARQ